MRLEDGSKVEVIFLPMPAPLYFDGRQRFRPPTPNFYIGNAAVLVPTFNDPKDRLALGDPRRLFRDRPVVGIHAVGPRLGTRHAPLPDAAAAAMTTRRDRGSCRRPAVLVDLDVLERNIARQAERARAAGVNLRPHAKTHKCPEIARMQLAPGRPASRSRRPPRPRSSPTAGFEDIFIAYPVVGSGKAERLLALARKDPVGRRVRQPREARPGSRASSARRE